MLPSSNTCGSSGLGFIGTPKASEDPDSNSLFLVLFFPFLHEALTYPVMFVRYIDEATCHLFQHSYGFEVSLRTQMTQKHDMIPYN